MTEFRVIEIDFDVYKTIELERRGFSELPNSALRRLLKLPEIFEPAPEVGSNNASGEGRPWAGDGIVLPHNTQLRMTYNGSVHLGSIQDGAWVVEAGTFHSPSAAAGAVGRTKRGNKTKLDGWGYWEAKLPSEANWVRISRMRSAAASDRMLPR